jgi:MFS family permease
MIQYAFRKSKRALHQLAGLNYAEGMPLNEGQRSCLHNMYVNGIFSNFSDGSAANYTNLFMVALGATNTQIGFMSTLVQGLAAIAPLPGAYLAERMRAYRASILYPGITARIGYLALAVLPFMQIGQPVIALAIFVFAARSLLTSSVGAQWTAAMGVMVPIRMRAAYFSARNFAGGVAVILGTLIAGQIITFFGFPRGYQLVYLIAALVGFVASYFYSLVPRAAYGHLESRPREKTRPSVRSLFGEVRSQSVFIRYMLCSGALSFAVNLSAPFIGLYQIRVLGFNPATIGLIASSELAMNIVMQRVYGSFVIPRLGDYRVMSVLRFGTAFVPFFWMLVTGPIGGVLASFFSGAMWSGHDLANFNVQLELAPEKNRANLIAINTVVASLSAAIGPAIGGVLTDSIGYQPVFIISVLLRLVAAAMLVLLLRDWARHKPVTPVVI